MINNYALVSLFLDIQFIILFSQQNLYSFIFSSSFSNIRTHSNGMVSVPFKRYNMIREKSLNNKMDQIKFYHITRNLKANFVEWILVTFMRTLLTYACYLFWDKGRWQYFSRYLYPVQSFHLFHSFVVRLLISPPGVSWPASRAFSLGCYRVACVDRALPTSTFFISSSKGAWFFLSQIGVTNFFQAIWSGG